MSKPHWMSDAEWEAIGARVNARQQTVMAAELEFARSQTTVISAAELQRWFDMPASEEGES